MKLIEQVKSRMGLNIYEARIYTALLSRGICSAGELADMSSVPRSRCYDVLESLEKKGFVFQKLGRPIKYIAIPPTEVVDTLKKQAKQEEALRLSLIDEFKAAGLLPELQQVYEKGSTHFNQSDVSTLITGKNDINLFLKDLFSNAKKSIVIHTDAEGAKRKNKLLRKSAKVGAKIHAPVDSLKNKARNVTLANHDTPLRMIHVDDEHLLFFTTPRDVESEQEAAVWVKSPFAVETLRQFLK